MGIHRSASATWIEQRGGDVIDFSPLVRTPDRNFIEGIKTTRSFSGGIELQDNAPQLLASTSGQPEILALDVHHDDAVGPCQQGRDNYADAFAAAGRCDGAYVPLADIAKDAFAKRLKPSGEIDCPVCHNLIRLISSVSPQLALPWTSTTRRRLTDK